MRFAGWHCYRAVGLIFAAALACVAGPDAGKPLPDRAVRRFGTNRFSHFRAVLSLAVSPDGKAVASADWDGTVRVWTAADGKELSRWTAPGERGSDNATEAVRFLPDGRRLAIGGSGGVLFWDWRKEEEGRVFASKKLIATCRSAPWSSRYWVGPVQGLAEVGRFDQRV